MKVSKLTSIKPAAMPQSWSLKDWPASVFPNDPKKAKYILREYRDDLLAVGAISRVGREIIIFGEGYGRFLVSGMQRVQGYAIAPNALKQAA